MLYLDIMILGLTEIQSENGIFIHRLFCLVRSATLMYGQN